jgi:hypothetical protein
LPDPSGGSITFVAVWRFADTRSYSDLPGWDGIVHVITIRREDEMRKVRVWITASAHSSDPLSLPPQVADALRTSGRSVLRGELRKHDPPMHVVVSSTSIDHRVPVAA